MRLARSRITVILADSRPMYRLGLRALLQEYQEFEIQEAGDLPELAALAARARPPATALIDLDLPPVGGAAAVQQIRDSAAAPVVWCGGSRLTSDVVYELVRAGAIGILRKEVPARSVVRALRAAGRGEAPLPRDLVSELLRRIHSLNGPAAARPPMTSLSSREREVLALVAEGHSNKTIAGKLYISEFTAKRHVQNVLTKLSLHSRQEAATRFREEVAGSPEALLFVPEPS
ncbi:MAG TPA: response regulator transcription factor [Gaiellaceae bacterium]|nr:response regulator transcription factor [Gaiellaceae bacterium]